MNEKERADFYVYIFLDPRKPGEWKYKDLVFNFQPFYVGKGTGNRIDEHFKNRSLARNDIKSILIIKITRDFKMDPIRYKIFENKTDSETKDIERDIIKHFGRMDKGTGILANMTDGGDGVVNAVVTPETRAKLSASRAKIAGPEWNSYYVHQKTPNGELVKTWEYLAQIKHELGYSLRKISYHLDSKKEAYGFLWERGGPSFKEKPLRLKRIKEKKVYQYSLEGEFIRSFDSIKEAKEKTGFKYLSLHHCKSGKHRHSGGFQWFYEDKGPKVPPVTLRKQIKNRKLKLNF